MRDFLLILIIILRISVSKEDYIHSLTENLIFPIVHERQLQTLSPMEALDRVKERYASNFDKVQVDPKGTDYYYKLKTAELYLAYEGEVEESHDYILHLYEFVVDDEASGIGHIVTYGWYTVDRRSGAIKSKEY